MNFAEIIHFYLTTQEVTLYFFTEKWRYVSIRCNFFPQKQGKYDKTWWRHDSNFCLFCSWKLWVSPFFVIILLLLSAALTNVELLRTTNLAWNGKTKPMEEDGNAHTFQRRKNEFVKSAPYVHTFLKSHETYCWGGVSKMISWNIVGKVGKSCTVSKYLDFAHIK